MIGHSARARVLGPEDQPLAQWVGTAAQKHGHRFGQRPGQGPDRRLGAGQGREGPRRAAVAAVVAGRGDMGVRGRRPRRREAAPGFRRGRGGRSGRAWRVLVEAGFRVVDGREASRRLSVMVSCRRGRSDRHSGRRRVRPQCSAGAFVPYCSPRTVRQSALPWLPQCLTERGESGRLRWYHSATNLALPVAGWPDSFEEDAVPGGLAPKGPIHRSPGQRPGESAGGSHEPRRGSSRAMAARMPGQRRGAIA